MRRGRMVTGVTALTAAALIAVPGALAGASQQIYKDLADGQLNGHYTAAQIQAFLKDATAQQYPNKGTTLPNTGVLAKKKTITSKKATPTKRVAAPLTTTKRGGTLPFTGAELWLFALVGCALIAGGVLLNTTGRRKKSRS